MVEFRILGAFEAVAGRQELSLGSVQQRAVLALLLVRAPEPTSRDRLIDELWGERPPASAAHALQVYASGIRKALRPAGDDAVAVRSSPAGYVLEVEADRIDARRFERLIEEAQRVLTDDPAAARDSFERALGLWRGAPLAEFGEFEFARLEADRLEELRAVGQEGLVEARLACGEHGEVIGTLTGLVAANPLRERPRRLLMLALYRSGRHAEALAAYRDACAALDEIGLQPGPQLRQLEQAILQHDPALVPSGVPYQPRPETEESGSPQWPVRPGLRRSYVPTPAHALVGRADELSTALALLGRDDIRLVTMLGPGGSGKTRLALEVASKLTDGYRDGAWFVSLAPLTDPALVVPEIAHTLGLKETDQPVGLTLAEALSERELLLVLDNFEHVLGAATAIGSLVGSSRRVDVLITSREPLRVRGEHRVDVPPLPLQHAVELFAQRAREVRPDLDVVGEDHGATERICVRLDRLPLALELAAAWTSVFGARTLEARLAAGLNLSEAPRDLPKRQRSLNATIDWSYKLLEPAGRVLLESLAPFVGGVRADSAEAVWGPDALQGLLSLAEKSLLRRREDLDREPRFWMLETIRQFARERAAENGVADEANDRHAAYFLALSEEAARRLDGREQGRWLERLEDEHANLRVALDRLTEQGSTEAVRMAANLEWFWIIRDRRRRAKLSCGSARCRSDRESAAESSAGRRRTHRAAVGRGGGSTTVAARGAHAGDVGKGRAVSRTGSQSSRLGCRGIGRSRRQCRASQAGHCRREESQGRLGVKPRSQQLCHHDRERRKPRGGARTP